MFRVCVMHETDHCKALGTSASTVYWCMCTPYREIVQAVSWTVCGETRCVCCGLFRCVFVGMRLTSAAGDAADV
jgi:hypothetical protein